MREQRHPFDAYRSKSIKYGFAGGREALVQAGVVLQPLEDGKPAFRYWNLKGRRISARLYWGLSLPNLVPGKVRKFKEFDFGEDEVLSKIQRLSDRLKSLQSIQPTNWGNRL